MRGYLQYCGGCSVQWGDNISTVGVALVLWRVFSTLGDNISTCREITSVQWGDNISTVEGIQYSGGITSVQWGDNISTVGG